jgi:replicative DNA helicase
MTSGLQDSELIIIAARPSMGKTAWAINIAQNSAVRDGKVVAVFSLEMSKESLLRRMLASEALVNSRKIQTGFLPKEDKGKLMAALERLDGVEDVHRRHTGHHARRDARQSPPAQAAGGPLDLIVIDYLQLMTGSAGPGKKGFENRNQEVAAVSRGLRLSRRR